MTKPRRDRNDITSDRFVESENTIPAAAFAAGRRHARQMKVLRAWGQLHEAVGELRGGELADLVLDGCLAPSSIMSLGRRARRA